MRIISHRGMWTHASEKNTEIAFRRSFEHGFGTETDIRDCAGAHVISHDPPIGDELPLRRFLEIYVSAGMGLPLALNVKSDGLQEAIARLLTEFGVENVFFFDMAIPDAMGYIGRRLPIFTRQSDVEPTPCLYKEADGIWIDTLRENWLMEAAIETHLINGKQVCVVSPELHGRNHQKCWEMLAEIRCSNNANLMVCTDFPIEAREYFG